MDLAKAKKIHEGKFSIVYLVEKGGEQYIVKQLHPRLAQVPAAIEQFRAEAAIPSFAGISPQVWELKEQGGNYYILKEYIDGMTLQHIHRKYHRKKHHPAYIRFYTLLCHQLQALHNQGYIHGDIKPSNILFTGKKFDDETGGIRLLDLGLAVKKNQLPQKRKEKPLHFSMLYGAPELMLNEPALLSELTDLFSLGICMYESFAGDVPYRENHPGVLLQMMLSLPLFKKKKVPQEIFELISVISCKPVFNKPVAYSSVEETVHALQDNLAQRMTIRSAGELGKMLEHVTK